jgi:hypothetical protein
MDQQNQDENHESANTHKINKSLVMNKVKIGIESFQAIHEKAQDMIEKMNSFNGMYSNKNNTTKESSKDITEDLMKCCEIIDQQTNEMVDIWSDYYHKLDSIQEKTQRQNEKDDELFKKIYMDMVTEAFADELDDLRKGTPVKETSKKKGKKRSIVDADDEEALRLQNVVLPKCHEIAKPLTNNDVKVLASCLESGMDVWSEEERRYLIQRERDGNKIDSTKMTIHEHRRRSLFGE